MLKGKNIIVGVTGSIAAYKAAVLVRALVKAGAEVRVVMTPLAKEFITPLTMATLSRHPVPVEFFNPENGEWNSHVMHSSSRRRLLTLSPKWPPGSPIISC